MSGLILPDTKQAKVGPDIQESSWRYKAIWETKGNTTPLGSLLLAVLGFARKPPAFDKTGRITKDGFVETEFLSRDGRMGKIRLGAVSEFQDEWRRLADKLDIKDWERKEMFAEIKKWIAKDERLTKEGYLDG